MSDDTGPSAPVELAVVAADPLARIGLTTLIESGDSSFLVEASYRPDELGELGEHEYPIGQLLVWDCEGEDVHAIAAHASRARVLALLDSKDEADKLWQAGVMAVLPRGVEAHRLAAALHCVSLDLRVRERGDATSGESSNKVLPLAVPELSPRELEVLVMIGDGAANKEIAEALGISVNTAKFHLRSILKKLGAESRTEAVVLAARFGLLTL